MGDVPVCDCGLQTTKNPHPDAGKPFTLCEVGAVWVCIPCLSKSRHEWCGRALDAENKVTEIRQLTTKAKELSESGESSDG
jgi:hypothetical protein